MEYEILSLPKGNGKFRKIYKVSHERKLFLKTFIPELEAILLKVDFCNANYAFEKGKNCALNAIQHVGHKYTLSFDICDFFDNINRSHLENIIPNNILDNCLIDGSPKQGLPTSPLIATIALMRCDSIIIATLKKLKIEATYTRYADDLTFGFNFKSDAGKIKTIVPQILDIFNLKINKKKTKFQNLNNGRMIVNGIGIDNEGIHPTRKTKKKIRAATYQNNQKSLNGLTEWSKCKLPRDFLRPLNANHLSPPIAYGAADWTQV